MTHRRRAVDLARLSALSLLTSVLASCRSAEVESPVGEERVQQPARPAVQELEELLPATGIRWALRLLPRRLLTDELLLQEAKPLVSNARMTAFHAASGIDLNEVEELWLAGYPLGTLLVVDGKLGGATIVGAFERRAHSVERMDSSDGSRTWITGIVDERPQALFAFHDHFVVIADGDPGLGKVARAHAEGRLSTTPSALETRLMKPIAAYRAHLPAVLFLFGPYEQATDSVMQGFAAGVFEFEHRTGVLRVDALARGVWPPDSPGLTGWLGSLLRTPELRAFGLGAPVQAPEASCAGEEAGAPETLTRCRVHLEFSAADVARSTYLVTQAPMAELLAEPEAQPSRNQN